jgi:hypothetical protein
MDKHVADAKIRDELEWLGHGLGFKGPSGLTRFGSDWFRRFHFWFSRPFFH